MRKIVLLFVHTSESRGQILWFCAVVTNLQIISIPLVELLRKRFG